MESLQLTQAPVVETSMLIRKPVTQVFEAFIDPAITTKFWFTKSSGKMKAGDVLTWEWEMFGFATQVSVLKVEKNERILIEWGTEEVTSVEWLFTARSSDATMVTIRSEGFNGDGDQIVANAIDAKGGFTSLLCGLKAFLEHELQLNVVADTAPDANIAY